MELIFSLETFTFLFLVAITAGVVDTLAGVGGLIVLPALILIGLPPLTALGTNKAQSFAGTGTASYMMLIYKKITIKQMKPLMIFAFIGSFIGTVMVQFIDNDSLSIIIPIVLMIIVLYFIVSPRMKEISSEARISDNLYKYTFAPIIGFYDGMFGPGTGSFFTVSSVALRGKSLIDATANAKALNFATNVGSLIVFLYLGVVIFPIAIVMIVGQFIGARIGSKFLIDINPTFLRYFVILLCIAMLGRYFNLI
jgi:uncharacterized membrane protein YfcA|tara:strand:- start:668 stop:1426 length:759 start_codon:yes stop_codon:yes gene_type:complete